MATKLFTPQEAAVLVLKKAEELYKSSNLAKGDWAKIHSKLKREGYSEDSADKIDGSIKAKMNKSDEEGRNPDEKEDADLGEKVEQDVQEHEEQNPEAEAKEAEGQEPKMKGHMKLARFMGRMDHKKEQKSKEMDKAEGGAGSYGSGGTAMNQKGVHQRQPSGDKPGQSQAGALNQLGQDIKSPKHQEGAKDMHRETLNQIHQMSKPKLPG